MHILVLCYLYRSVQNLELLQQLLVLNFLRVPCAVLLVPRARAVRL